MKVRISGNKIRFRVKEPEVKRFQKEGVLSEVLEFGDSENDRLKFTLKESDLDEIFVKFQSNETIVFVPRAQCETWTLTELVGFDADVDTGKGKIVSVFVEKDFMCMDGREEDNIGSYPNPLAAS